MSDMSPRFSAGLVPFRCTAEGLEVFLVHMAGPYWAHKDEGAWSIAKGEYDPRTEDPREVAEREFVEEVGMPVPNGRWLDVGEFTMPSGKQVRAFALETDADLGFVSSNLFTMEWPPRSGRMLQFPETDDAGWFPIVVAEGKLVSGQLPLLDLLARAVPESAQDNGGPCG
jgi:predicted NUDIX family NTP pyrophosphohydrolase